jgi:hypothetical protein
MFFHKKDPIHTVQVDKADPCFAQLLLEQFGRATEPTLPQRQALVKPTKL